MAAPLRVADVIRSCWESYNRSESLPPHVVKAVRHILGCRTAALGGHIHECDQCGSEVPMYNSCQNRHCPTCQTSAKEKWLAKRREELLPVQYFHSVFTLPHALNELIDANRTLLLGELFATVNWVLQRFARDPRWRLEGELGFLAVLHTWTQQLNRHFHLHCIVPGGVWRAGRSSEDGPEHTGEWIHCRGQWLFRKDSLADAFRNRYLKRLRALRRRGKLRFSGRAAPLAEQDRLGRADRQGREPDLGRLSQTRTRRRREGPGLPRPLHPQGRHRRPSHRLFRRRRGHLHLARPQ